MTAAEYVTPHSGNDNDLLIVVTVAHTRNVLKTVELLKLNFSR